jgi:hypothetical protein
MIEHLKARNIEYWSHFKFAFGAGLVLMSAGIISMIHAIYPDFMPSYAEKKTLALARLARIKDAKRNNANSKQTVNN